MGCNSTSDSSASAPETSDTADDASVGWAVDPAVMTDRGDAARPRALSGPGRFRHFSHQSHATAATL